MTLKTFLQGYSFQRIVLFAWLVSSGLVIFSQKSIDAIVHGTLYGYGLQFSNNWAQPYWAYAHILYACQFVSIALSTVALVFGFLKKDNGDKRTPKREESNDKPVSKAEQDDDKPPSKREQNAHISVSAREKTTGRTTGISCPTCKKTLSKPLVMLHFSDGEAMLVNVCPYCNAVLGKAEEQNETQTKADQGKEVVR